MASVQFPFPSVTSTVLPPPSPNLFLPRLGKPPVPTNAFWQNYALNEISSEPEYIHPYVVRSNNGSLFLSYPRRTVDVASIIQAFVADIIISTIGGTFPSYLTASHRITDYNDLSVTLQLPGFHVPLVRGSPYISLLFDPQQPIQISTLHAITSFIPSAGNTKFKVALNNGQTWLIYSSAALPLTQNGNSLTTSGHYLGVVRIALLSDGSNTVSTNPAAMESTLDKYYKTLPVSGSAELQGRNKIAYSFNVIRMGTMLESDLLMLSHPVQRQLLKGAQLKPEVTYKSLDGDLVGVTGLNWLLEETAQIPITWHSFPAATDNIAANKAQIVNALQQDIAALKLDLPSTYFYGKAIAKAARLALIAEEIGYTEVIPQIVGTMKTSLSTWLDGTFQGNAILYEGKWGGLISKGSANDKGGDFGLGLYNDHHFHFGYFTYAIAVLAKLDYAWAAQYKSKAYAIVLDYMSHNRDRMYPRIRNFDFWKLHSWASGITEFGDGRNQESTSEAINGYYAAALLGLAYSDPRLENLAATLLHLEIRSARSFWHIPSTSTLYDSVFANENRIMGIVWSTKRDTGLWFAPKEAKEMRTGIQTLPLTPVTEALFCDAKYVQELVEWTLPALNREGVTDGWRAFTYALQGIYQTQEALTKVQALGAQDDGNTLTNMLWWLYSRPDPSSLAQAAYCPTITV